MTWWTGSAIGFDTETDGKDPTDARIITAATVQIVPWAPPVEAEIMVKPERPIDPEAAAIHGISTERAEAEGMPRERAVRMIVDALALAGENCPVAGHNISYDLTVLDREMRRTGVGRLSVEPGSGQVSMIVDGKHMTTFPVFDSHVIDKAVDQYRPGKRRLDVTAEHYGVAMAEGAAHGATADVIASLRILIEIARRTEMSAEGLLQIYGDRRRPYEIGEAFWRLGNMSLAEIHTAQIGWKAEQADGLREYFRTSGTGDPNDVDGSWPIRVLHEDAAIVADVLTEGETTA